MSTLQFDEVEIKSIFTLMAIENLAKELAKQKGFKFNLSNLKYKKEIKGDWEMLKELQLALLKAKLPTGEISD